MLRTSVPLIGALDESDKYQRAMTRRKTHLWNTVLALAAYKGNDLVPCGSAVLVGQSLALTATHVADNPFDRRLLTGNAKVDDDFGMVALQRIDHSEHALSWAVVAAHQFPVPSDDDTDNRSIDVCLLELDPIPPYIPSLEHHRRWFPELNVAPPEIGETVTAYGYTNATAREDGVPDSFYMTNRSTKVTGTVTDVFFPHRDRGMLPFPCFEVSADFQSGMSGGPIINSKDQVCGVVSSGGLTGYGSTLWPLMAIKFQEKYVLDLAREGRLRVANLHCIELHHSDDHRFPGISFDPRKVRK